MFWCGHQQLVLHLTPHDISIRVQSCFVCAGLYLFTTILCAWQILLYKVESVGWRVVLCLLYGACVEDADVAQAHFSARAAH